LDTYATVFSKESVADTTTTTAGGTSAATSSPSNQQQLEEEAVVDEGHETVKGNMAEGEKNYAASSKEVDMTPQHFYGGQGFGPD
jgi:hypothetical protein